jgi:hypothetical protein
MINPEKNIFCMDWNPSNQYQTQHKEDRNLDELIDFFFPREVKYLTAFLKKSWAPEIIDIDYKNKQIFFKWYGETCNNIVYSNRSITSEYPSWSSQLKQVITEIYELGYYKMSLYPHCFFFDNQGTLKTFDFYSCTEHQSNLIPFDKIKGMIGPHSLERFNEALDRDYVDISILFKRGLNEYIKWPDDILKDLHRDLYGQ